MLDHGHRSSVCGPYTIYVVLLLYVWCLYKGLVLLLYDTTAHSGKYLMVKGCKLGSGYYIYCFVEFYYTTPDNLIGINSIKNLFFLLKWIVICTARGTIRFERLSYRIWLKTYFTHKSLSQLAYKTHLHKK